MDATTSPASPYRFGVAIGLALAAIVVLGWQAVAHAPYRAMYDEVTGSAAVLPPLTTVVLSVPFRVGAPAALLLAVLVLHRGRQPVAAAAVAILGWAAVAAAHFGAIAPLHALSQAIVAP